MKICSWYATHSYSSEDVKLLYFKYNFFSPFFSAHILKLTELPNHSLLNNLQNHSSLQKWAKNYFSSLESNLIDSIWPIVFRYTLLHQHTRGICHRIIQIECPSDKSISLPLSNYSKKFKSMLQMVHTLPSTESWSLLLQLDKETASFLLT